MLRMAVILGLLCIGASAMAQEIDADLWKYISSIKLIDNHAHVVAPDMEHDTNYDALRCETLPATPNALAPANTRFGPDISGSWKALYGVTADSDSAENVKRVAEAQKGVREKQGAGYFDWVLAQGGYDVVLANRVKMAPELDRQHFKWVPYDDALLFPLSNAALKAANPDRNVLFSAEEAHLKEYLSAAGLTALPQTLDEYVAKLVVPTLQSQKKNGAVAIKYEVAYLRPLDFEPAAHDSAASVYAKYVSGGTPSPSDYKLLQDYLFQAIGLEVGELGMAVHIHTGGGCGDYFDVRGSDPMLLSSVLNEPSLRKTNFVLLHGGSPFERHNTTLIAKPNVWVDTSVLELMFSPSEFARILRPWLETMPEHVIFGTDAGPFGSGFGWEETSYVASHRARQALGIVLTDMMREKVITPARAKEIAERVLRGNAAELYKLQ